MKKTVIRYIATVVLLLAGAFGVYLPVHAQGDGVGETNRQLLAAAKDGDQASVLAALQNGAAVDAMNRIGDTALITACKKGDVAMARMLIDHGANVQHMDAPGVTPLMAAAYGGFDEIVALLLGHGADLSATDRIGKTAMEYAAGQGQTCL